MMSEQRESIESRLASVADSLPDQLTWSWDDRFDVVLAEFEVTESAALRDILSEQLPRILDTNLLPNAGDAERAIARELGGLMPGQLLFVSDPIDGSIIFSAWWPWGNGRRISIRIGLKSHAASELEESTAAKLLQTHFVD